MAYLGDIEEFVREWQIARIEFCRRFEINRAEILKDGVFGYTSWHTPRTLLEQRRFTIRYCQDRGVVVYHGNGDKAQQDDMFAAPDLTAWCMERLWSYRNVKKQIQENYGKD